MRRILLAGNQYHRCDGNDAGLCKRVTGRLEPQKKLTVPLVKVADKVPEGKLVEKYDNGNKKFETDVKNRRFNYYLDIYYPNGKLRNHTPLINCKAEGLSGLHAGR